MIREGPFRIRRAPGNHRLSDVGHLANFRREWRGRPGVQVPDRLDVVHLVFEKGHRRSDVQLADDERMAALLEGPRRTSERRHHRPDDLRALSNPLARRADGRLAHEPTRRLEGVREPGLERAGDFWGDESRHRPQATARHP